MEENELDSVVDEQGMRDENINISDVIEVIETDLEFREVPARPASPTATAINNATMFNGGGEISNYHLPKQPQTASTSSRSQRAGYRIEIIEQPAQKALRFRYECEGRSAGSIPGASSTPENKTFPAIKVVGGPPRKAVVVVSCVTKDHPYRPHPHKLVGREGCKRGVCTLEIPPETMSVSFSNLGIQCVKKKDIEEALRVREEIRVDPFKTGFSHRNQPTSIDLNTVRLCFQVFLENENQTGKYTVQLDPKVSDPICDKKAMSDLNIVMLSDAVSPCNGGKLVILLCEKVAKEDIQVRFYDDADGWETFAEIQPAQVHKQHAIWFKTPAYKRVDIVDKVRVQVQLRRPSDGSVSDSRPFEFWPLNSANKSKRKRALDDKDVTELKFNNPNFLNIPQGNIKMEPRDSTSPMYPNLSPQGYNIIHDPSPTPSPDTMYPNSPEVYYNPQLTPESNWETGPSTSRGPTRSPLMQNQMFQMNVVNPAFSTASPTQFETPRQLQYELSPAGGQFGQWEGAQPDNQTIFNMDNQTINSVDLNMANMANIPDLNNLSLSDIVPDVTTDSLTNLVNSRADDMFFKQ